LRIVGILFALTLAVSLVLVPVTVLAQDGQGGLAQCELEPPAKWWDNPISHDLYLNHWGRTPIQAMSRLGGLCGPDMLCERIGTNCPGVPVYGAANACWPGGCPSCRDVEPGCLACCDDIANCNESKCPTACPTMGISECPTPDCCTCNSERVFEDKLPHCAGCWGISLAFANKSWAAADIGTHPRINNNHPAHFGTSECTGGNHGGDWGLSGCPHTECCTLSWCLQDNCFTGEKCAPQ
jgi:hypothetical protein